MTWFRTPPVSSRRPVRLLSWFAVLPLLAVAVAGAAPGAATDDAPATILPGFGMSWSLDFASRYSFQGVNYSNNDPVMQPSLSIGYGGVSGSFWFNHDLHRQRSDEYDFSLEYSHDVGRFGLAGGYTALRYPHREGWSPSAEFYVDCDIDAALSPSLSVHDDIDAGRGVYLTAGASHDLFAKPVPLSLGADLFYQEHYYDTTGFPALQASLGTTFALWKIRLSPAVSRFFTWANGSFRGANAIAPAWVTTLSVGGD